MSGYTTTPNFGLYKPTVNGDDSQWGNHLNSNADIIDNLFKTQFLPVAGGAVGPLTVNGSFTVNAGASTLNGSLQINPTTGGPPTSLEITAPSGIGAGINLHRTSGQYAWIRGSTGPGGSPALDLSSRRWEIDICDNTPETGTNLGSNFVVGRCADNGTFIDNPLSISRATGAVTLGGALTVNAAYPTPGITSISDVHCNRNLFVGEGNAAGVLNYILMSITGAGDATANLIKQQNRSAWITGSSQAGGVQSNRWQIVLGDNTTETGTGNTGSNFAIRNYADTGNTLLGTPLAINRATGGISLASLQASTSYANDAAAATGGVAVAQLYRNGSAVMVRVT